VRRGGSHVPSLFFSARSRAGEREGEGGREGGREREREAGLNSRSTKKKNSSPGVLGLPAASKARFDFEDGQPREFVEGEDPTSLPAAGKKFAKINWLKAGCLAADAVLTVSPNYAKEICSGPAGGVELDGVFRSVGVEGIVNGRNTPAPAASGAASSLLPLEFDASTVAEGKAVAKETLQAELGLPVDPDAALFGFVGRLEEQKGVDVLLAAIPGLVARAGGKKVQVAVLGTGKKVLEAQVSALSEKFPGVASGTVAFSAPLAALITAGADFFVVCSRQEPCGLVQLDAMARGTIPVVSTVGGLVDTVKEGATGYHVGRIDPDGLAAEDVEALAATLARAAAAHGSPAHEAMRDRCISQDLSWAKPAAKWEAVLEDLSSGGPTAETGAKKAAVTTPVAAV
jgi:granule-bound starch synthase